MKRKATLGHYMNVKMKRSVKKEWLKIFFINFSGGKANNFTIYSHYEGLLWKSPKNNCNKLSKKIDAVLAEKEGKKDACYHKVRADTTFGHLHMRPVLC